MSLNRDVDKMRRIVFLDIDGVLCTARAHAAYAMKGGQWLYWDPLGCTLLRRLCKETCAEIVISSTWRNHKDDLFTRLREHNLVEYLHEDWKTGASMSSRGEEIDVWIKNHFDIGSYVILDDDRDMLPEQLSHFVFVEHDGISFENFRKMEAILTK